MKTTDFNRIYEKAKTIEIRTNEYFNFAGFFWLNLTDKQHNKMVKLLIDQGAEPVVKNDGKWVYLENGLGLRVNE